MKSITNNTIQKRIMVGVMAAVMLFGMFAFAPSVKAETDRMEQMRTQIAQLLEMVQALQSQLAVMRGGTNENGLEGGFTDRDISIGDMVQTVDSLKVRARAGSQGELRGVQVPFAQGKVIAGPRQGDRYTWWQVAYNNGVTGWSAENWLRVLSAAPTDAAPASEQPQFIEVTVIDPSIDGPTKIELTAPRDGARLPWTGAKKTFNISWEAENVPENSVIVWETKSIRLFSGYAGGGSGFDVIPSGDSTGTRVYTYGPSYSDPGEYKVRVTVRECHSQGCKISPTFPGQEEDVEIYAESDWHEYTIGDIDDEVYETDGNVEIYDISVNPDPSYLDETMVISWELDGIDSDDYLTCVTVESYEGGHFSPTSGTSEGTCEEARDGTNTHKWVPTSQPGFRFDPGKYKVEIRVLDEDTGSGKDRGTLAIRTGEWFEVKNSSQQDDLQGILDGLVDQVSDLSQKASPLPRVNYVSSKEQLLTGDSSVVNDDYGMFTLTIDVTADDGDIYIPVGSYGNAPDTGFDYSIIESDDGVLGVSSKDIDTGSMNFTSTAEKSSNQYVVREGDTEEFTITAKVDPVDAGKFKMRLDRVRYYTDGAKQDTLYSVNVVDLSIDTGYLSIDGSGIPRNGSLGTYKGYMNGNLFITTKDIKETDAYENCLLNANNNPSTEVYCTWSDKMIFDNRDEVTPPVVDSMAIGAGAYEGTYPTGVRHSYGYHPQGHVEVYISDGNQPAGSVTLVVTAYEPVRWKVTGPGAYQIGRVFASGYYDQEVTGVDAKIIMQSHESGHRNYFYSHKPSGANYDELINYISRKLDVYMHSYISKYSLDRVKFNSSTWDE